MAEKLQIYKCMKCGNIVEVVHGGPGNLVCCNQDMILLNENSTDAATEKHVPVVEKIDGGYKVTVGSVEHPMVDDHYIEWIELLYGETNSVVHLKPGDPPIAVFKLDADSVIARAYCNLHGLWKA